MVNTQTITPQDTPSASLRTVTMLWLQTLTPVHVGAGRGAGAIDLPIVREAVTHLPYVPSSEIKGALSARSGASADFRELTKLSSDLEAGQQQLAKYAFGVEHGAAEGGGALVFCDARLVCFPARSLYGTFAWLACPLTLQRLKRDLKIFLQVKDDLPCVPTVTGDAQLLAASNSCLALADNACFIEDLKMDMTRQEDDAPFARWATILAQNWFPGDQDWQNMFKERFALVSDEAFGFLTETACEVRARVRLKEETKTVKDGHLWYEEYLPQESLLAAPVWCDTLAPTKATEIRKHLEAPNCSDDEIRAKLLAHYCKDQSLRLGGKQSIGKGQCSARFAWPRLPQNTENP